MFEAPARPPEAPRPGMYSCLVLAFDLDVVTRDEGGDDAPCGVASRRVLRTRRLVIEHGQAAAACWTSSGQAPSLAASGMTVSTTVPSEA